MAEVGNKYYIMLVGIANERNILDQILKVTRNFVIERLLVVVLVFEDANLIEAKGVSQEFF
jgi:hypothetical protein